MPEEKKDKNGGGGVDAFTRVAEIAIILALLGGLYNTVAPRLSDFLTRQTDGFLFSIPPQAIEDERLLLGGILSGDLTLRDVSFGVGRNSFSDTRNRATYEAIEELTQRNGLINANNVLATLTDLGWRVIPEDKIYLEGITIEYENKVLAAGGGGLLTRTSQIIKTILAWLGIISLIGISYIIIKMTYLRREQLKLAFDILPEKDTGGADARWARIVFLSNSENPQDRKIAVMDADNILDEMVTQMGYSGDTLGERMKNIETSDFRTLQDAWQAHRFRNRIAHEGLEVSRRDAKIVIGLFEKVFQEFEYI